MSTEIVTRAEAIAKGLKSYFTGKPCKFGHIAARVLLGRCGVCSVCRKKIASDWRENNRQKHNNWSRQNPDARRLINEKYLKNHPESRKKTALDWVARNKEQHRKYQRELKKRLRQEDADWRFRTNLRGRLHKALTRASAAKSGRTMELIGCTVPEMKAYLAKLFTVGMTWENYGHGPDRWNVDHRIPCAAFDLTDPEQQLQCFNFRNLQPMWHVDNVAKGDRVDAAQDQAWGGQYLF